MATSKFTHTGKLLGCDARAPTGYSRTVKLRETKCYWVDETGLRYHKKHGDRAGLERPVFYLHIPSIRPIGGEQNDRV